MNPAVLGKDVSEIIGNDYPAVGVAIQSAADAEKVIAELKPDVCIIATRSTVAELEDIFTICAKNGVNAITTCEEALYPWNSSPVLTAKLDALASKLGLTITSQTQKCVPCTWETDLESKTLGRTIKAGEATGMRAIVTSATVELTCATLVNRIAQLIDAPAGYVTTDQFPYNEYMLRPINEYVKTK